METMRCWQQKSLSLAATMQSFFVGSNMAHRVLITSTHQEHAHLVHLTKRKRAGSRGGIELVGLTWVCNQLNCCCDSQSSYSYDIVFVVATFPVIKHSVLCKHNT